MLLWNVLFQTQWPCVMGSVAVMDNVYDSIGDAMAMLTVGTEAMN